MLLLQLQYNINAYMVRFIKYRPQTLVRQFVDSANPNDQEYEVLDSIFAGIPDEKKKFYDLTSKPDRELFESFGLANTPAVVVSSVTDCGQIIECKLQFGEDVYKGEHWEDKIVHCW